MVIPNRSVLRNVHKNMSRKGKQGRRKKAGKATENAPPVQSASPSLKQQAPTIQQSLDFAVQHHTAGRLPEAESIYQQILQADPNQPVALHLLGVIALQVGNHNTAVDLITKALAITPDYVEAHNNLGLAFKELGKLDEAMASYHKALASKPDYAEAHNNLGTVFQDLGRLDEAIASYHKALATKPDYAEVHNNLGTAFQDLGRLDEAVASYHKALAIKPDYVEARHNLGNALQKLGRLDEALASYHKALDIKPDYAKVHSNLGIVLKDLGKLDEAVVSYHKAIAITPDYVEAYYNLGNALRELGRLDEALASYHKALAIKPDYAEVHNNLGNALKKLGKLDQAVASYHKALAVKPDYAEAHYNLGIVLHELGRLDEAVASYHRALAVKPDYAEAWNNLQLATRAFQFSKVGEGQAGEDSANGLKDAARATVNYAIHQFYLAGFKPHEADESFETVIASLPPTAEQTILINGAGRGETEDSRLPDKVVALLRHGRSGTGLLHSLIDGHPEISTLPSVYLRGYFNEGVWDKLSADGWRGLPERFADEFAVLFDARTSKSIPSRLGEPSFYIGKNEGMTSVGENRDEFLSLDRVLFCGAALRLMEGMESVDPMSFLMVVHAAFEEVIESTGEPGTNKRLCFYHIHNPDDYAKPNFLRYASDARLLMTVREPIQSCESSLYVSFKENNYDKCVPRILEMLFDIDQIPFRMRESVGVRLEDLKNRPVATMQSLRSWLGIMETPSLYRATAQGKKWWGDPSSPDYDANKAMSPFYKSSIRRATGVIFSKKDQFVLRTLFYPFCVRFLYTKPDPVKFENNLKEIRPLLDDMLDFEKVMAERLNIDHAQFRRNGTYQLFRAGLVDRWEVLDKFGDYPYMLEPLPIP